MVWLLPRHHLGIAFFIAPVVGLTVFASLGLFKIGVLLVPLSPVTLSVQIGLFFIVTAWIRRDQLKAVVAGVKTHCAFFVLPVALLTLLAIGSRDHGLSFLSAGQDEIQYVNNALHILKHQHTGDALDTVVPRIDHWVYDGVTRDLSYSRTYRRGAEIFLAGVMGINGGNPFISFTVAAVIAFCCFLLALPAICRAFLGMGSFYSMVTQALLGTSHLWIMLVLQGSLANLCSLGLFCLATAAVPQLNSSRQLGASVLAGLLLAGPIIFYNEVAMAVLLVPMGLLLVISCLNSRTYFKTSLHNVPIALGAMFLFSHTALYGLVWTTYRMVEKTLGESALISPLSISSSTGVLAPIFGIYTYYSQSFANNWLAQLTSTTPWAVLGPIVFLQFVAAWALFRQRQPGAYVLGTAFLVLVAVTLHSLTISQPFMLVRSQQYAFSYVAIGLIIAVSLLKKWQIKLPVILITLCLMAINISSIWSTVQHLSKHNDRSDPIIFRYSPKSDLWQQFLKNTNAPENTPILITGYNTTAKPHLIASLIEPRPNYFGASIRKFWPIMTTSVISTVSDVSTVKKESYFLYFLHHFFSADSHAAHENILALFPFKVDMAHEIEEMDKKSRLAIIMSGSEDPEEWRERRLIQLKRKRFFPIGDIIERSVWSPVRVEIDGQNVHPQYSGSKHVNKEITIHLQHRNENIVYEFELVFDSMIREEDITSNIEKNENFQLSFNGKILTGRTLTGNIDYFSIKFLQKKGLDLTALRIVEVF